MPSELAPLLLVRSGARLCAFPVRHVVETMRPLPVEPAGQAPAAFILGLTVIRGAPVPVVKLAALLGDGDSPAASRYVTLRVGERRVALAVEEVLDLRELDASAFEEMPPLLREGAGGAVEAVGALDSQLLLVLRAARLIPEEVWQALEAGGT